jgi:hypothetical protein
MRAPVYRHVDGQSTVAGVSLNGFVGLLGVALAAIQLLAFGSSLAVIAGTYALLRLAGRGRPPLHWQHLVVLHVRRAVAGGRLSAAARARVPQFPHGPYLFRDAGR